MMKKTDFEKQRFKPLRKQSGRRRIVLTLLLALAASVSIYGACNVKNASGKMVKATLTAELAAPNTPTKYSVKPDDAAPEKVQFEVVVKIAGEADEKYYEDLEIDTSSVTDGPVTVDFEYTYDRGTPKQDGDCTVTVPFTYEVVEYCVAKDSNGQECGLTPPCGSCQTADGCPYKSCNCPGHIFCNNCHLYFPVGTTHLNKNCPQNKTHCPCNVNNCPNQPDKSCKYCRINGCNQVGNCPKCPDCPKLECQGCYHYPCPGGCGKVDVTHGKCKCGQYRCNHSQDHCPGECGKAGACPIRCSDCGTYQCQTGSKAHVDRPCGVHKLCEDCDCKCECRCAKCDGYHCNGCSCSNCDCGGGGSNPGPNPEPNPEEAPHSNCPQASSSSDPQPPMIDAGVDVNLILKDTERFHDHLVKAHLSVRKDGKLYYSTGRKGCGGSSNVNMTLNEGTYEFFLTITGKDRYNKDYHQFTPDILLASTDDQFCYKVLLADAQLGQPFVNVKGRKIYELSVAKVDLQIDSDNSATAADDGIDEADDKVEENSPGKLILVNNSDSDGDGIPDYADGFNSTAGANSGANASAKFTPLKIVVEKGTFDVSAAKITFTYSASDPAQTKKSGNGTIDNPHVYSPAAGNLRIWKKNGAESRDSKSIANGGDFIPSATAFDFSKLGSGNEIELYVEGIKAGSALGDLDIKIELNPDGKGTQKAEDLVKVSVGNLELEFDKDLNGDNTDRLAFRDYIPGYFETTNSSGVDASGKAYKLPIDWGRQQAMKVVMEGFSNMSGIKVRLKNTSSYEGFTVNSDVTKPSGVQDIYAAGSPDFILKSGGKLAGEFSALTVNADGKIVDLELICRDYGGTTVMEIEYDGNKFEFPIPIDNDGDAVADKWEIEKVQEWNSDFAESNTVDANFFSAADDKEIAFNTTKNRSVGKTVGDGISLFEEYRGVLVNGGVDVKENTKLVPFKRLSPARKDLMFEVDIMSNVMNKNYVDASSTTNPQAQIYLDNAKLTEWMNYSADLYKTANLYMYFQYDDDSLAHDTFTSSTGKSIGSDLADYADEERTDNNSYEKISKHIIIADELQTSDGTVNVREGSPAGWDMFTATFMLMKTLITAPQIKPPRGTVSPKNTFRYILDHEAMHSLIDAVSLMDSGSKTGWTSEEHMIDPDNDGFYTNFIYDYANQKWIYKKAYGGVEYTFDAKRSYYFDSSGNPLPQAGSGEDPSDSNVMMWNTSIERTRSQTVIHDRTKKLIELKR